MEYGIFIDEGCIEDGFASREAAEAAGRRRYAEDGAHVSEICPEHPGQEREYCEVCNAEDAEAEE